MVPFKSLYWTIYCNKICYNIASLFYTLVFRPPGFRDLSFPNRNWTCTPCIGRQILSHWAMRGVSWSSFLSRWTWFSWVKPSMEPDIFLLTLLLMWGMGDHVLPSASLQGSGKQPPWPLDRTGCCKSASLDPHVKGSTSPCGISSSSLRPQKQDPRAPRPDVEREAWIIFHKLVTFPPQGC